MMVQDSPIIEETENEEVSYASGHEGTLSRAHDDTTARLARKNDGAKKRQREGTMGRRSKTAAIGNTRLQHQQEAHRTICT